jgi:hypothetical protein
MKPVKFLRDASIIVAITIALLVVYEAILRIVFPDKIGEPKHKLAAESIAYEFNKDYLVSLKPNIKKTFVRSVQNGGDVIEWQTNADSFRGPNLKHKPTARIIVYGDSNIQAIFSKSENTYAVKLSEYLNSNGIANVEVVNAGVIGFGPDQSLIRFELEADTYKPNLVVFGIFVDNDFGDIIRNRLFDLDANGNLVETRYKKTADEQLIIDNGLNLKDLLSSLLIFRATSKLSRLLKGNNVNIAEEKLNMLQNLAAEEYLVYKESRPKTFSHFADHYDIDIALDKDKESSKVKLKLMEAVLRRASAVAISHDIKFLVLIQPSRVDTTDNDALNYKYLEKYPKYKGSRLTDVVENICLANNIHYVNLRDIFMRNNPNHLFFKGDDDHWNDQGQDLAAKETAWYIAAHKMLERK